MEINNISVKGLWTVLKKETLPEHYWILETDARLNCERLLSQNIRNSEDMFELFQDENRMKKIAADANIGKTFIQYLHSLLSFHRFKPISIEKIEDVEQRIIDALLNNSIKDTGSLLLQGKSGKNRLVLSNRTKIPMKELRHIVSMADLMRKPGIKAIKAGLFMKIGIKSLFDLGRQDPVKFRSLLQKVISGTKVVKAVPKPKEVESDILWARVYPDIVGL